jgi:hypothetical protein
MNVDLISCYKFIIFTCGNFSGILIEIKKQKIEDRDNSPEDSDYI